MLFVLIALIVLLLLTIGGVLIRRHLKKINQGPKKKLSVSKHLNLEDNENQAENNSNIQNLPLPSEQKNIKQTQSTQKKSQKQSMKMQKQQLIDDQLAFQFNDDSENDEEEKDSSGNATDQHTSKEMHGFTFQQSEHKLEELVTPSIVNTVES